MATTETKIDTTPETPLADAYVAACEAAEQAQAAYDDIDQDQAASDADATAHGWERMGDYLGHLSSEADKVRDAARQAWLDSDEVREYEYRGESLGGGCEEGHWCAPSEVEADLDAWGQVGWDTTEGTVYATNWARPIDPHSGDTVDDTDYEVQVTATTEPDEPDCEDEHEHDWQSPYEVLGGNKENPGVWGKGGGVIIKEVCAHCGAYKVTDTWAQRRDTGEQGLTEVSYEDADAESSAWVASLTATEDDEE